MITLVLLIQLTASFIFFSNSSSVSAAQDSTFAQVTSGPQADACKGLELTGGDCSTGGVEVNEVITSVIKILSILVGVVSVIMIIIGGFKYVISSGDANNTKSAKDTILYALIGLVIAVLAQVIVAFVLNKVK